MKMSENIGGNGQLKAIVERIENIETEMKERSDDRKEIYLEAKGGGFDVKVLRKIIALRKKDPAAREEEDALMETYLHALDMLS
jgi:uncharacterized protein (UPF0335 family)